MADWMKPIKTYRDALKHFESVTPWKTRPTDPKPYWKRYADYTMQKLEDGAIEFCMHKNPLATWHPNGDVTVHPGVWSNGYMANAVTPDGVHPIPRQEVVGFSGPSGLPPWGRWIQEATDKTSYGWRFVREKSSDGYVVSDRVALRIRRRGKCWRILNEEDLVDFVWRSPDRSAARKISAAHNLPEFGNWLRMVTTLDEKAVKPATLGKADPERALELIAERKFPEAADYLPLKPYYNWWRTGGSSLLEAADLDYLRALLYRQQPGALMVNRRSKLTWAQFNTRKTYLWRYGTPT